MHKAVSVCNCYTNEEFMCNLHVAGYASYKSSQEKTAVVLTVKKWTLRINKQVAPVGHDIGIMCRA